MRCYMRSSRHVASVVLLAGPIAIVEGRHPIIESRDDMSFQCNDTFMAEASSFHIITGPNMAGKSTYLRQVCPPPVTQHPPYDLPS